MGQMAVCCQKLMLDALFMLVGVLFKKFVEELIGTTEYLTL
jgi:hypothetical protein